MIILGNCKIIVIITWEYILNGSDNDNAHIKSYRLTIYVATMRWSACNKHLSAPLLGYLYCAYSPFSPNTYNLYNAYIDTEGSRFVGLHTYK